NSGVTMTSSSVLLRFTARLVKSLPSSGMLASPGILLMVSVMLLCIRPAITKLCPLSSSTSVWMRRVLNVERADFRGTLELDDPARRDARQETNANTEFAEGDTDRFPPEARLNH